MLRQNDVFHTTQHLTELPVCTPNTKKCTTKKKQAIIPASLAGQTQPASSRFLFFFPVNFSFHIPQICGSCFASPKLPFLFRFFTDAMQRYKKSTSITGLVYFQTLAKTSPTLYKSNCNDANSVSRLPFLENLFHRLPSRYNESSGSMRKRCRHDSLAYFST